MPVLKVRLNHRSEEKKILLQGTRTLISNL